MRSVKKIFVILFLVHIFIVFPNKSQAVTTNILADNIGTGDNTGDILTDIQFDDATLSPDTTSTVSGGDNVYTVTQGSSLAIDRFDISSLPSNVVIENVSLNIEFGAEDGYDGSLFVQYDNGSGLQNTNLQPTDITGWSGNQSFDLFLNGVDTLSEIQNLSVSFDNNSSQPRAIHFDYISIQVEYKISTIRSTEYFITYGDYNGTDYTLTLDQDLESNYFVIVLGADGNGSGGINTGPNNNYAALVSDPFSTGDLAYSGGSDLLGFSRGANAVGWSGVITVVECLGDCDQSGFKLLDIQNVVHTGSLTSGTDNSNVSWSNIDSIMLMGGYNGAGCYTTNAGEAIHNTCNARIWPSASNTIEWSRNDTGAPLTESTSTVMVIEWGSEWNVQRRNVTGTFGAGGANTPQAYGSSSINPVQRQNTWVWGVGHTGDNGIGDGSEATLITLGDGINVNATESSVSLGREYIEVHSFEVYALEHPDLSVDYFFKPDGNYLDLTYVANTAVAENSNSRMSLVYNTSNGTGNAYATPMFFSRYISDSTIQIERRRIGQDWTAWLQGINFASITYDNSLSVNIVDSNYQVVANPSVTMTSTNFNFNTTSSTGILGNPNEMIQLTNNTNNQNWSVTLAAGSPTDLWSDGNSSMDFNDPSSGTVDGPDGDNVGGQLSVDPSVATVTRGDSGSISGISLGSSAAFIENTVDSITLFSSSGAATNNDYLLTGVQLQQNIPPGQAAGTYTLDVVLTAM